MRADESALESLTCASINFELVQIFMREVEGQISLDRALYKMRPTLILVLPFHSQAQKVHSRNLLKRNVWAR